MENESRVTPPAWPTTQKGDKSLNVYALQCLLNYHGASISVDGSYGNGTYNAVVSYQRANGINADGIAGPTTWIPLVVEVTNNASGNAAKAAQYLLTKFQVIDVDGSFGSKSQAAAKTFQQNMGISANGIINKLTWRYLLGYCLYPYSGTGDVYANVCGSGMSGFTTAQLTSNAKYILQYLDAQGFTKEAACGVLGNMEKESEINPAEWAKLDDLTEAYGLVQWYPATNFLNRARDIGILSAATADAVNGLANSDPVQLMNTELASLIWCCEKGDFYPPKLNSSMDHSDYRLTFAEFKASTLSAGTLAIVFHDHYERSQDGTAALEKRKEYAEKWFETLKI